MKKVRQCHLVFYLLPHDSSSTLILEDIERKWINGHHHSCSKLVLETKVVTLYSSTLYKESALLESKVASQECKKSSAATTSRPTGT